MFFQITRTGALPPETVFVSTTTNRGYVNSGDYIGLVNQHVTFEAGQARAMVQVQILDDGVAENDERFGLIVQRDAADPLTTFLAGTTFTVVDNDSTPTNYVISPNPAFVDEGGIIYFAINRLGNLPAETIYASTAANHDTSNNNDYSAILNQPVPFAAGQAQAFVYVFHGRNAVFENPEAFDLIAHRSIGDPTTSLLASSTFVLEDRSYLIDPPISRVDEGSGTQNFTIFRSPGLPAETVFVSTTTRLGSNNDNDYVGLLNHPVFFDTYETSATFVISITDDNNILLLKILCRWMKL